MGHLGGGVRSLAAEAHADTTRMSPVYWRGPSKQYIFVSHGNGPTESFEFTGSSMNTTPSGSNSITQADRSGGMSLSANGNSEGIFWLIDSDHVVRAYDRKGICRYVPPLPRPGIPALGITNCPAGVGWSLQLLPQHVQREVK
jgi:hypothetical protein